MDFIDYNSDTYILLEATDKTHHFGWAAEDPAITFEWGASDFEDYDGDVVQVDRYRTASDWHNYLVGIHLPDGRMLYEMTYYFGLGDYEQDS